MTEIQKRLFEDLCILKGILDKNNISYYLAYGTLLGAVRHHGFIPWDNDVDIYVKIQDIPRLRMVLNKEDCRLKIHDHTSHANYPYSIPKVVDVKSILKEKEFEHLDYECGVYIDLFPLIEIPDNKYYRFWLEKKRYFYYGLVKYYNIRQRRFLRLHKFIKKMINLSSVHTRMEENLLSPQRNGFYVTDPLAFDEKLQYPKAIFEKTVEVVFEGVQFKAPADFEYYLNKTYGDYMQLPPENQRVANHDFVFKIQD